MRAQSSTKWHPPAIHELMRSSTLSYPAYLFLLSGIYDMAGNVSEWVSDSYDQDYYETSPLLNPTRSSVSPYEGRYKVHRGGSWVGISYFLRSAMRYHVALTDPPQPPWCLAQCPKGSEVARSLAGVWSEANLTSSRCSTSQRR